MSLILEKGDASRVITHSGVSQFKRQALAAALKQFDADGLQATDELLNMTADALIKSDYSQPFELDVFVANPGPHSSMWAVHLGMNMGSREQRFVRLPAGVPETQQAITTVGELHRGKKLSTGHVHMQLLWMAAEWDRAERLESGRSAPDNKTLYAALQELFEPLLGKRDVSHRDYYYHLSKVVAGRINRFNPPVEGLTMEQLGRKLRNIGLSAGLDMEKLTVFHTPWDARTTPPVDSFTDQLWQVMFRAAEFEDADALAKANQGDLIRIVSALMKPDGRRQAKTKMAELWLAVNGMLDGDAGHKERLDILATTTPGKVSDAVRKAFNGAKRIVGELAGAGMNHERAALHFRVALTAQSRVIPSLEMPNIHAGGRVTGIWANYATDHRVDGGGNIKSRIAFLMNGDTLKALATTQEMLGGHLMDIMDPGNISGQARQFPSCEITSRMNNGILIVESADLMGRFEAYHGLFTLNAMTRMVSLQLTRGFPVEVILVLRHLANLLMADSVKLSKDVRELTLEPEQKHELPDVKRATEVMNECLELPQFAPTKPKKLNVKMLGPSRRTGLKDPELELVSLEEHSLLNYVDYVTVREKGGLGNVVDLTHWIYSCGAIKGIERPFYAPAYQPSQRLTLAKAQRMVDDAMPRLRNRTWPDRFRYKGIPARLVVSWDETLGWTLTADTVIPVEGAMLELGVVSEVQADALGDMKTVIAQQEQYGTLNETKMQSAIGRMGSRAAVFFKHVTVMRSNP